MLIQLPVANIKLRLLDARLFSRQLSHIIIHLLKKWLIGNSAGLLFLPISSSQLSVSGRVTYSLTGIINFKAICCYPQG
jgi:hypothetical protein